MNTQDKNRKMRANALSVARIERDGRMLHDVESAIAGIIQDNQTLSFYRVAERARIARSTLYRKPELRSLVEQAREHQAAIAKRASVSRVDLLEENELLRQEIEELTCKFQAILSDSCRATQALSGGIFEYAVIDFVLAA